MYINNQTEALSKLHAGGEVAAAYLKAFNSGTTAAK